MGRSLLKMSNDEIYESSLRFIFKQFDLYVEANKEKYNNSQIKGKDNKNNNRSEENKLMVLD